MISKVIHFNATQLAERWGVCSATLDRWRQRGRGPLFIKIGNHVVYRLCDIEAYENAQLRQTTDKDLGVPIDGTAV
ncbi:MAG: DNA-binding protein [Alphaproteobacteria bacterium]|nr:DNA-binding protein [Alphaproteobacteria bacterium]